MSLLKSLGYRCLLESPKKEIWRIPGAYPQKDHVHHDVVHTRRIPAAIGAVTWEDSEWLHVAAMCGKL